MNETSVRISKIVISGIKNTQYGQIEMPSAIEKDYFSLSADILGIYGQNGSGKTAVVEAMALLCWQENLFPKKLDILFQKIWIP